MECQGAERAHDGRTRTDGGQDLLLKIAVRAAVALIVPARAAGALSPRAKQGNTRHPLGLLPSRAAPAGRANRMKYTYVGNISRGGFGRVDRCQGEDGTMY